MKEDILAGNYKDPFELDESAYDRINGYGDIVNELSEKLNEDLNKLHRKRKEAQYETDEETGEKVRKVRPVNIGSEPWEGDQELTWPDYEAESFENALESFRKRPVSNTGYENKALNKKMQDRWGKDFADKCIKDKLFKEDVSKRFNRKLAKKVGLKEAKKLKLVESVEEENSLFIEEVASAFGAKVVKGWYGAGFIVPNTDYATCFVDGVVLDPIYSGKLMCLIGKGSPMSVRAKSIGNFAVPENTDKVVSKIKSYIESEVADAAAVKSNYQAIINSVSDLRDVKYTMEITPNTTLIMIAKNGYYGNVMDAINELNQYEDRITTSHGDFGEYFEDSYEDLNPKYRDLEVVAITYKD